MLTWCAVFTFSHIHQAGVITEGTQRTSNRFFGSLRTVMPDGTLVRVITLVRGRDAGRPTAVVSGRAERPRVREPRLPTVVASEAVGAF